MIKPILLTLLALQLPVLSADYKFTKLFVGVWDSKRNLDTIANNFEVADNGIVAFQTILAQDGGSAVFGQTAHSTTYLVDAAGSVQQVFAEDGIFGSQSFLLSSVNSSGVMAGSSPGDFSLYTLSRGSSPKKFGSASLLFLGPTINDQGDVAYADGSKIIKRKADGSLVTMANASTNLVSAGHITANGMVPFQVSAGLTGFNGIYLARDSGVTTIFETSAFIPNLTSSVPAANDSGAVAYITTSAMDPLPAKALPDDVYLGSGGAVSTVRSGTYGGRSVSISNTGSVAYHYANISDTRLPVRDGIYTSGDLDKGKVIEVGASLFGSTVQSVRSHTIYGRQMNSLGEIAFIYQLANGEYGLALASPITSGGGAGLVISNSVGLSGTNGIAPDSIATLSGSGLATATATAPSGPQASLANSSVTVTDSAGVARPALLFYASPNQINCLIPAATAPGTATLKVTSGDGSTVSGSVTIALVVPGVFSLNSAGLVAANVLRVTNGVQAYENVYQINGSAVEARPINPGSDGEDVYLVIYGTGFRAGKLPSVTIGGQNLSVLYSGASGAGPGLDQLNVGPLPKTLHGSQTIRFSISAISSNDTTILLTP